MICKILTVVFAAAVLTVGGYTYWHYSDGHCCGAPPTATQHPNDCADLPPCCLEPSRTSCFGLPKGEACCEDIDLTRPPVPEVLTIQPREVQ
jgi:hypothetical protein